MTSLKDALKSYNTNPFDKGPAKAFTSGVELNSKVIKGLLKAPTLGNEKFLECVNSRLIEQTKSIYAPIKRQNIDTGMKKIKKTPRKITVLKEDVQAFGLLVEKAVSLEEAFSYPITSLPLSIAHSDGTLRQGNKSIFRNLLIKIRNPSDGCSVDIRWSWHFLEQ